MPLGAYVAAVALFSLSSLELLQMPTKQVAKCSSPASAMSLGAYTSSPSFLLGNEICSLGMKLSPIQAVIAGKKISFSAGESLLSKFYTLVVGIEHVQWSVAAARILGQCNRTEIQILLYTTLGTLFLTNRASPCMYISISGGIGGIMPIAS